MPEAPAAPPPTAPTNEPTPTPQAPEAPSAPAESPVEDMQGMLDRFDKLPGETSEKAQPPPKETEKPKAEEAAPEAPRPAPKGPAKTEPKPAGKPEVKQEKSFAPAQLRKRLEEIEKEYEGFKTTASQEREKLTRQIAEIERRPFLTPEMQKQLDAREERLKQLEADLYARDFRESPEFNEKFQAKWQSIYKDATQRVANMRVEHEDPETGEKKVFTVGVPEFEKVRMAPPEEQLELADKLFGKYAFLVMQDISALRSIENAANDEVTNRHKTFHERRQEAQANAKRYNEAYEAAHSEIDRQLVEKYPQYFGEDATKPEETEALKKGLDVVDSILKDAPTETVGGRAAKAAMIRRWAAAFPRMVEVVKRMQAEIDARDQELAKYRESDPGSGGEDAAGGDSRAEAEPSIEDMAARFDARR